MKILCTGGGTGGHIYPALSILDKVRELCQQQNRALEILWIGRRQALTQQLVTRAGIPYRRVTSGQLKAVNPLIQCLSVVRLGVGVLQALWIVLRYRPDICLATGGNAAAPSALACALLRVPLLVFLPDAEPGLTTRWLGRVAQQVLITTEAAAAHFPGNAVLTGYPVRSDLLNAAQGPAQARARIQARMNLNPGSGDPLPLLLVMGGSQGAQAINRTIQDLLPGLLAQCLVLHVTGERDFAACQDRWQAMNLPPALASRYALRAYLHTELADAFVAADVAVLRAGASVLGEVPASETPAILIPLPGSGGHQWANAQALAAHQACHVVAEERLAIDLLPTLTELLTRTDMRHQIRAQLRPLARPQAAAKAAQLMLALAGHDRPYHA